MFYEDWVAQTGEDTNSIVRQEPLFVDAPLNNDFTENRWGFRIPDTVAEARSWFQLIAGSPGKGAASDGTDMGFLDGSLPGGGCGNGALDAGELCDPGPPEQLDGNDCTTIAGGFTGGVLHCNSTCSTWDVSECTAGGGDTVPPATPTNLRRTDKKP